jgi:putative endonuclease
LTWDAGSTPAASSLRSEQSDERRLPRRSPLQAGEGGLIARSRDCSELRLGKPDEVGTKLRCRLISQIEDMDFTCVYILQSKADLARYYTGLTDDIKDRLRRHNAGEVSHTAKFKPWRIKTAIAFTDRDRAAAFEQYLKSASGRAFAKKRL